MKELQPRIGRAEGLREELPQTQPIEERLNQRMGAELTTIGYVLQGSITTRSMACGKVACRCTDDPEARHGPYHAWT